MIIRPAITLPTIGEISRQGAELPSPLQLKHGDEIVVPIRFPSTRQITTFPQCRLSVCISMESGNVAHDIESLTRVVGGDNEWEATVRILRFGNYAGSGTLTVILNSSHADLGFVSDVTRSWAIDVQSRRRAPRFSNFSLAGQIFSFNVLWHENVGSAFSNADISISSSNTAVQVSDIAVTPNPNNRERDFIVTSRVIGFGEVTFTARIPAGAIPENEPAGTFYEATVEYTESYCSSGNRPFATLGTALDTARGIIQTNDGDTEATAIRGRNQFIVPMSWSPTEDLGLRVSEFDIIDIRIITEPIDLEVRLTATNSHVARPEDAPKTTLIIRITQS